MPSLLFRSSPAADPKSSELPVEPSSLLNQKYCLKCEQRSEMTSSQATATEPTEAANQIDRHSVGQQTDIPTSPVAKEVCLHFLYDVLVTVVPIW